MKFKNIKINKNKLALLLTGITLVVGMTGCNNKDNSNNQVVTETQFNNTDAFNELQAENDLLRDEITRLQEKLSNNDNFNELEVENESLREELTKLQEELSNASNSKEQSETIYEKWQEEYSNPEYISDYYIEELYLGTITDVNTQKKELYIFCNYVEGFDDTPTKLQECNYAFGACYNYHTPDEKCDDICTQYAHIFEGELKPLYLCLTKEQQEIISANCSEVSRSQLQSILKELRDDYHSKNKSKKLTK